MTAQADDPTYDRRDALRRRIYLVCLLLGTPVVATTWVVHRATDPFLAVAYPPYVLTSIVVLVGLWRRTMRVRTAEQVVLVVNAAVYLAGLAVGLLGPNAQPELRDQLSVFSLLTVNLLFMLAYVAFETRRALHVSLGIFAAFLAIVVARLVPDMVAGRLSADVVDYLRITMFMIASVGLLHIIAQVKEQAAEARATAAAMTRLANTDALTGIANRRRLHEVLEERALGDRSAQRSLAVILLDLDHFKQVNDAHGHEAGDVVLRQVGETLAAAVRDTDLLGRWGGEEFLIIAPDTTPADAATLAERCRASLAAASFPHVGTVTASLGVAMLGPGDTAWRLLRRADEALYRAKAAGRDQVRHQPAVPAPRLAPRPP